MTTTHFECSICYSEVPKIHKKKNNCLECPQCNHLFCVDCQKQYAKAECINCHLTFKHRFIQELLGQSFIDKVIKPAIIAEIMVEQKQELKNVQPLVEWERELRKQKKNTRFGIPMTLPERPSVETTKNLNHIFPCPDSNCRGFIENGTCGVCNYAVCTMCREQKHENHVCCVETLQSIAALAQDSKPCPKCCAIIYRTDGCNHMFCTNCRTHFDWVSGKILKTSSNGHYLHLQQFSQNVATREIENVGDCSEENEGRFSIFHHRIALDDIDQESLPLNLIHALWMDSNSIRLAKRKLYNEQTIQETTRQNLQEQQVRYLLNDVSEDAWSKQVYQIIRKKNLSLLYAEVFNIYLETVDALQMACVAPHPDVDTIINNYNKLIELCNESFQSIADEYSGASHRFRDYNANMNDAPFTSI